MNPYLQMSSYAFCFFVLPIAGPVVLAKAVMWAKAMFLRRFAAKSAAISQSSVSAPAPMDVAPPNAFTESHLEEFQGMEIPVHGGLPPEFEAQPVVAAAASHQASKQSDLFEANRNTEFDPLPDPVMDF